MPELHYLDTSYGNLGQNVGSGLANIAAMRRSLPVLLNEARYKNAMYNLELKRLMQEQQLAQDKMLAEAPLREAQRQEAMSRSGQLSEQGLLDVLKQQELQKKLQYADALSAAMPGMLPQPSYMTVPSTFGAGAMRYGGATDADVAMAKALGGVIAQAPSDAVKQMFQFRQGMDPTAGALGANSIANLIATGSRVPFQREQLTTLSPGAMAISPSGQVVATNTNVPTAMGYRLTPEQQLMLKMATAAAMGLGQTYIPTKTGPTMLDTLQPIMDKLGPYFRGTNAVPVRVPVYPGGQPGGATTDQEYDYDPATGTLVPR